MSKFLCAVHTEGATLRAAVLVEQTDAPAYVVRTIHASPTAQDVADLLASEPQYVAATTVIASGGQPGADVLHAVGLTASPVTLDGSGSPATALQTTLGVLVGTFERVYRDGDVHIPGEVDGASDAVAALYTSADLDAAAAGSDRDADGDLDAGAGTPIGGADAQAGPNRAIVEQSGNAAGLSTRVVDDRSGRHAAGVIGARDTDEGRVAAEPGTAPDLGDRSGVATALALAVWFGEATRDALPRTGQATQAAKARANG